MNVCQIPLFQNYLKFEVLITVVKKFMSRKLSTGVVLQVPFLEK